MSNCASWNRAQISMYSPGFEGWDLFMRSIIYIKPKLPDLVLNWVKLSQTGTNTQTRDFSVLITLISVHFNSPIWDNLTHFWPHLTPKSAVLQATASRWQHWTIELVLNSHLRAFNSTTWRHTSQIWSKIGSNLPQMGQIWDFLRSVFSTFWRRAPKFTENWS